MAENLSSQALDQSNPTEKFSDDPRRQQAYEDVNKTATEHLNLFRTAFKQAYPGTDLTVYDLACLAAAALNPVYISTPQRHPLMRAVWGDILESRVAELLHEHGIKHPLEVVKSKLVGVDGKPLRG